MIKLKDLLELKTMVYSDEVKPKHEKKINKTTKLFHNELTLPMIKPPENDHSITLDELKYLESVNGNIHIHNNNLQFIFYACNVDFWELQILHLLEGYEHHLSSLESNGCDNA